MFGATDAIGQSPQRELIAFFVQLSERRVILFHGFTFLCVVVVLSLNVGFVQSQTLSLQDMKGIWSIFGVGVSSDIEGSLVMNGDGTGVYTGRSHLVQVFGSESKVYEHKNPLEDSLPYLLLRNNSIEKDVIRLRSEISKTEQGRVLALEGPLADIIERRRAERKGKYIFYRNGRQIGDIRKSWRSSCRKAGVPGMLFHDLRRSAVRNMVRAGVPERVAMSISGHTTRSIFDRYNIVSEAGLREAVDRTHTYRKTKTSRGKKRDDH